MAALPSYRLVPYNFSVAVTLACQACARPLTIKLDDLEGPFTCRQCSAKIQVPPLRCFYEETCDGVYERCAGSILKLEGEELARERAAAWEGQLDPDGRPTDESHDDAREIEGSVRGYRCARCGETYSLAYAVTRRFDDHGRTRCERAICGRCLRVPSTDELRARG